MWTVRRLGPPGKSPRLSELRRLCERHQHSLTSKLGSLAVRCSPIGRRSFGPCSTPVCH